jgi:hypothetical protein
LQDRLLIEFQDAVQFILIGIHKDRSSRNAHSSLVHGSNELRGAIEHDFGSLTIGFVVAKAGFVSGGLTSSLSRLNFGDFSPMLISSLTLAITQLSFDSPSDCDSLRRGEILSDFVFGVLSNDDALNIHDPGKDCLLLQNVSNCSKSPLIKHQFESVRHADGLEQSFLLNTFGK